MSFSFAGKDGDPFGEGEIRRDDRGATLVPIREQIEEQLAAGAVKGHEAELVDDQQGTVEVGKKANLVLLGANPLADISNTRQVAAVILNGRLIRGADLQKIR